MEKRCDRQFYLSLINETLIECTHDDEIFWHDFENKVSGIKAAAAVDGFSPNEFDTWVHQCVGHRSPKVA